jgi:hypothetical protein
MATIRNEYICSCNSRFNFVAMLSTHLIDYGALATGALSFTLALAWNTAAYNTTRLMLPTVAAHSAVWINLINALMVTMIVVVIVAFSNHVRVVYDAHAPRPIAPESSLIYARGDESRRRGRVYRNLFAGGSCAAGGISPSPSHLRQC